MADFAYLKSQPGIFKIVESIIMFLIFCLGARWYEIGEPKITVANTLELVLLIISIVFITLHVFCDCSMTRLEFVHAIVACVVCCIAAVMYSIFFDKNCDGRFVGGCNEVFINCILAWIVTILFFADACCLNKSRS